jgi:hypothetical protein
MSHFYFCLPWLLESCIPVIFFFICTPLLFFSFWKITVLWFITTQIVLNHICVIFSRRMMSLSICSMVQLYITKEWKYSTNVNCQCQSKTEESKGCKYYLPDLKSDCNNGGKLLYFKVYFLIGYALTFTHVWINSSIDRNINPVSSMKYQCRWINIWSNPRAFQCILNCQSSHIWTYLIWELWFYVTEMIKKKIKCSFCWK